MTSRNSPLVVLLLIAVGRALALMVVAVVVVTAVRGPIPGLSLQPASADSVVVLDSVDRVSAPAGTRAATVR